MEVMAESTTLLTVFSMAFRTNTHVAKLSARGKKPQIITHMPTKQHIRLSATRVQTLSRYM